MNNDVSVYSVTNDEDFNNLSRIEKVQYFNELSEKFAFLENCQKVIRQEVPSLFSCIFKSPFLGMIASYGLVFGFWLIILIIGFIYGCLFNWWVPSFINDLIISFLDFFVKTVYWNHLGFIATTICPMLGVALTFFFIWDFSAERNSIIKNKADAESTLSSHDVKNFIVATSYLGKEFTKSEPTSKMASYFENDIVNNLKEAKIRCIQELREEAESRAADNRARAIIKSQLATANEIRRLNDR